MTSVLRDPTKTQRVSAYQLVDNTKLARLLSGFSPPPRRYGCNLSRGHEAMRTGHLTLLPIPEIDVRCGGGRCMGRSPG